MWLIKKREKTTNLTGIVIKLPVVLPLVAFRLAYVFLVIGVATILFKMLLPKG